MTVVSILSNIMNVDNDMLSAAQVDAGSTNQLIMSLETLQRSVDLTDGAFIVVAPNIAVDIREVEPSVVARGLTFTSMNASSIEYVVEEGTRQFDNEAAASSIALPPSLGRLIFQGTCRMDIHMILYQTVVSFPFL